MENQTQLNLISNDISIVKAFREHKHNYMPLFRTVVSEPANVIMREFLINPEFFTMKEREVILRYYTSAIELRGAYSMMGKPLEDQISEKRMSMIPQIKTITDFFRCVYSESNRSCEPSNLRLYRKIYKSLELSDKFCDLLETMEVPGYGSSSVFCLRDIVDKAFRDDVTENSSEGTGLTYQYESYGGEFSSINVRMNEEGFKIHVLGNIIDNIHKRAFVNDEPENGAVVHLERDKKIKYGKFILMLSFRQFVVEKLKKVFYLSRKKDDTESYMDATERKSKIVKMKLEEDCSNPKRVNLYIMNNGKSFDGDVNSVFDWGVGFGSGIGLASARSYLREFDSNIRMITDIDDEFKVGFIINLPIYDC